MLSHQSTLVDTLGVIYYQDRGVVFLVVSFPYMSVLLSDILIRFGIIHLDLLPSS
ncbi:hypothetical protein LCGC14_2151650 [marine sediment metagenome]|uniref:Uncharacterized protein n=1 Tax=marine sediment metagenome TaxID=412755 RepID=A0A0F9GRR5_9ZZZZ